MSHAALDGVHLAWGVTDDEGWSWISLCLSNCLESLLEVCAHGNLSNIDVTIGHCNLSKVLLLDVLTSCCELCNLAKTGSLGRLTTSVGVNLSIEDKDVDVLAGSKNVVKATEADVVCPTVATEDPEGLLGEEALVSKDFLSCCKIRLLKLNYKSLRSFLGESCVVDGLNPCLSSILEVLRCAILVDKLLSKLQKTLLLCLVTKHQTHTVLCVVLEEGVVPCWTVTICIGSKW